MRQFIFPTKDGSIYEEVPTRNSGLDEILEVGKSDSGRYRIRSLLEFELPATIPINAEFELRLFTANSQKMNRNQLIRVLNQSQSWEEGDGYYYQDRIQNVSGATWREAMSGSSWTVTGSVSVGASYVSSAFSPSVEDKDFSISVTTLVRQAISASFNPSFVVALSDADESNRDIKTNIKFFSKDSHTIYRPMLVAKWDDQTFTTASLTPLSSLENHVQPRSLKPSYRSGEFATVYLSARARYPQKTFATSGSTYAGSSYLPSSSFFSVVDDQANIEIIPFDEYSKISCDSNGSFCRFRVEGMYPLRYYRLRFKIVFPDGRIEMFDDNHTFTVAL